MKKDIPFNKVEDVAVTIIPESNEFGEEIWNVYIINLKPEPIETVIVSSKGYGVIEGKAVKTSVLRQLLGNIEGEHFRLIEPIDQKLFGISNEFFISFWYKGMLYDKKYIFVTESIVESNFTDVPVLNKRGVMIK